MRDLEQKKEYQRKYYLKNKERLLSYRSDYYTRNKEVFLTRAKDWTKNNKHSRRANVIKSVYKISLEEYDLLFKKQEGCCQCCKTHQSDLTKTLHIDHDHKTGKIRGLLCSTCNSALGFVKDDITTLQNMIKYLENG